MISSMENSRHIRHYHRHFGFSYPSSIGQKIYSIFVVPLGLVFLIFLIAKFSLPTLAHLPQNTLSYLLFALGATFLRLLTAYILALLFALPSSLLIYYSPRAERIFLPLYDIIESVPVLAFFPIIILFFIKLNFFNGAAIFILFLSMLWNIVFTLVGGLKAIPSDVKSAAKIFHVRGFQLLRKVTLPAVFPHAVTGSLLAWAQGWNVIIVAEVLHTYIPGGSANHDLFGIGSTLVSASANGQNQLFLAAIFVLIVAIGFFNFVVWQKLLKYVERYKFE